MTYCFYCWVKRCMGAVTSVMSNSLQRYGLCSPSGSSCPWDSPGKNTGVGCHTLIQGIFLTQGSNLHLLHALSPALAGRFFTTSATWEAQIKGYAYLKFFQLY